MHPDIIYKFLETSFYSLDIYSYRRRPQGILVPTSDEVPTTKRSLLPEYLSTVPFQNKMA